MLERRGELNKCGIYGIKNNRDVVKECCNNVLSSFDMVRGDK